ncbi:type VI secretion system tip protein TssI/VgrG [Methylobacterium sp. 37f]|uniref:type VI secretion system Vgr family protein n=1 Tax=Methylobacterium sp. 37f TaxID=2817058 RepID=UPI001FFD9C74|nr:type VI secretion system tip protein TssI/VgrG [Methylobacterium sp. 37f]MCK2056124.1 type VI secretion system tip protein VgrG [Methylobacterium sp. 37f]
MQFDPSQTTRIAKLTTPVEGDKLVIAQFEAQEGLSELFEYRIDALSPNRNIDFSKSIGRACNVAFSGYRGAERHFNGILVEAQWTGEEQAYYAYRLVLRPWLWLLGQRGDCRIFSKMNVVKIIKEVFDKAGFGDYTVKANEVDYPDIEYCVQYRESDLTFVSRLMEEFGLYVFYEHSRDKHNLVLADSRSCHRKIPISGGLPFIPLVGDDRRDREHLSEWAAERRFRTGKITLNDHDYMKPTADLKSESTGSERYEKSNFEFYDYPGRYTEQDRGRSFAKVRLEAAQAADRRKYAEGDAISLHPGGLVVLMQHPTDNAEYLVVRARHTYTAEGYSSGYGSDAGENYRGHYEFLKSDQPFRAPLITPRPHIRGPQTGIVVAREKSRGEEIDVDEEGRIFVQFHWNRDTSKISRPVRVAQMWSGKSWGTQFIPRVGQEVVIEFLEGDPDQPLVVGTVYNKDFRYPYALPDNKTISGIKSDSTKGHNGYNEFVFEDKKSGETIRMRAEKDHDTVVRHAETRVIGETFETPVGSPARSTKIKNGDDQLKIDSGDWNATVGSKISFTATQEIVFKVGSSKITMTTSSIKIESGDIKIDGMFITQKASIIKIN